jgi:hypothetical protein
MSRVQLSMKRVTRECNGATRIRGIGKKTPTKRMQLDLGWESLSPVGGTEIRQDRWKMILFNAILAEAEASSLHPRWNFSAQIAANPSYLTRKSMKGLGRGRASR